MKILYLKGNTHQVMDLVQTVVTSLFANFQSISIITAKKYGKLKHVLKNFPGRLHLEVISEISRRPFSDFFT